MVHTRLRCNRRHLTILPTVARRLVFWRRRNWCQVSKEMEITLGGGLQVGTLIPSCSAVTTYKSGVQYERPSDVHLFRPFKHLADK